MALTEALRIVIQADTQGAVKAIERVGATSSRVAPRAEKDWDRIGRSFTRVGVGMVSVGAAGAAGLLSAANAASDLNEVASKSATVFGRSAAEVDAFAESADKIGLSKRAALEAASGFGNMFDQLGFASGAAADMSIGMTELSSDFASFHNADITQVLEAQSAAFRGEYDALQRFVPTINAAAVQQRALADTGKDAAGALTAGEKAAATYALIMEGAGQAVGDFERTQGSAANQQRKLTASFENLKAEIGAGALPVLETLLGVATDATGAFSGLNDATGGAAGGVATFGVAGLILAGGASTLIGQLIKMRTTFSGLGTVARGTALALGTIGVAITAIEVITSQREGRAEGWLEDQIGDIDTTSLDGVRDAIAEVRAELDDLDDREGKGRLFSVLGANVFATSGDADRQEKIDQAREKLAELEEQEESLVGQQRETAGAYAGTSDELDAMNESMAEAISGLETYAKALQAQFDPVFGLVDALNANQEAQQGVTDAQTALNEAVAEFGATSPEATDAQLALAEAQRQATGSALDVTGATAELNAAVAANPGLLESSKAQLATWVAQGLITQATADAMAAQFDTTAARAVALGQVDPNVTVSATDNASGKFTNIALRLFDLDGRSATVSVHANYTYSGYSGVPGAAEALRGIGRAHGGPVSAGRLYEVAEGGAAELLRMRGRSYLIPGMDGTVVPAMSAAPAMASGGGATYITNINVERVVADDPVTLIEGIKKYERTNGPGWRR